MKRALVFILVSLPVLAQAQAQEAASPAPTVNAGIGNLPPDFYPPSPCIRPRKKPQISDGPTESLRYNREVTAFTPCIQTYLDNAKRDVAHILKVVNAAGIGGELPAAVTALPAGGTNLPPDFYPKNSCTRPDKARVGAQPDIRDKAMAAYNQRVSQFNAEAAAFNACLKTYIAGARNDVANVQRTLSAALSNPPPVPESAAPRTGSRIR